VKYAFGEILDRGYLWILRDIERYYVGDMIVKYDRNLSAGRYASAKGRQVRRNNIEI